MFGDFCVPAQCVHQGTFRCVAPPHAAGSVLLRLGTTARGARPARALSNAGLLLARGGRSLSFMSDFMSASDR